MRVVMTIDPKDPHRIWVRDDAEFWLRHHARDRWRVRADEDFDGREVLTFEFMGPLDGVDFHNRIAPADHPGRIL
jgi:hypothetical protein